MTTLLCNEDAYLREFDATVTGVTEKGVVLDRTAFYPGGGGQPPDAGVLVAGTDKYTVKKLSRADGQIVHEIEGEEYPAEGTSVHGVVDWDRRYSLMRTHTALHILCGVVWRDYGALVTGGNMEPLTARMDFELESMSADFAREVELARSTKRSQRRGTSTSPSIRAKRRSPSRTSSARRSTSSPSRCSRYARST